jgi:phosphatidylserine/phosphatidylglycerophosphate/cardiolipin synthase-like enzyme
MTPEQSVARLAHCLAASLPISTVDAVASAILTSPAGSLRAEITKRVAHHQHRQHVLDFMDQWKAEAGGIQAQTIGVALQTAALAEQAHQDSHSVELVWTGPDCEQNAFRRTEQAIQQVLDSAKERITLVSFAVYQIPNIASALVRAAKRGVRLTVVVETPDKIEGHGEYSTIKALGTDVAGCSTVYYWPRENRLLGENSKPGILHVKCAVADGEWMFLSSANLTQQAFTINMELGILIRGGSLPGRVEHQFQQLIYVGQLMQI